MNTKKRRDIEIYEDYCSLTLEYTDFHGEKFLNCLKEVIKNIKSRNYQYISNDEYSLLQQDILKVNPKSAKDGLVSTRKSINQLVKLGFVSTKLNDYHRLSETYLNAPTKKYRNKLFSVIVAEAANFAANVSNHDGRKHVNFITETLMRIGELNKKQIIGLMTVDPLDYEKGYIDLKDLNKASERASKNLFFNRKYNQVSYLCNVLSKLDNLVFHDSKLFFEEDFRRQFQPDIDNKLIDRNSYLDKKSKELLEEENIEITGSKKICMVNNIEYPSLISSHIKRSEKCNYNEKYDHKNLLLISSEIDGPFDKGDISFEDNGDLLFAKNIKDDFKKIFYKKKLNNKFLDVDRKKYLHWNRLNWFNKNPNRHV
tara:strand:- start:108 stop:1217 length:1110 start_codon:yes stop_codon:yes gene_type:complete